MSERSNLHLTRKCGQRSLRGLVREETAQVLIQLCLSEDSFHPWTLRPPVLEPNHSLVAKPLDLEVKGHAFFPSVFREPNTHVGNRATAELPKRGDDLQGNGLCKLKSFHVLSVKFTKQWLSLPVDM